MEIVGKSFSVSAFKQYIASLNFAETNADLWVRFIVLHNTSSPTLAQRPAGLTYQHIENLQSYYEGLGWHAGPHLFIDDRQIWVFSPLTAPGVHSPSWNNCSWGIEQLGEYDSENYLSGRGLAVRTNTVAAIAILSHARGIDTSSLKLHKDDPLTTHKDCPGTNCSSDYSNIIADAHRYIVENLLPVS